jgi:hypothetical protein
VKDGSIKMIVNISFDVSSGHLALNKLLPQQNMHAQQNRINLNAIFICEVLLMF